MGSSTIAYIKNSDLGDTSTESLLSQIYDLLNDYRKKTYEENNINEIDVPYPRIWMKSMVSKFEYDPKCKFYTVSFCIFIPESEFSTKNAYVKFDWMKNTLPNEGRYLFIFPNSKDQTPEGGFALHLGAWGRSVKILDFIMSGIGLPFTMIPDDTSD